MRERCSSTILDLDVEAEGGPYYITLQPNFTDQFDDDELQLQL